MGPVVLLVLFALLVLVILPIWVFIKINSFSAANELLQSKIRSLELEMSRLRQQFQKSDTPTPAGVAPSGAPEPTVTLSPVLPPEPVISVPPPLVPVAPPVISTAPPVLPPAASPPSPPPISSRPPPIANSPNPRPRISWEQFMGAKLFAWVGGLAGFLAVAYFVKYSFEHDLIPPEVRVAIGFLLSAALVVGGLLLKPERFRITAQVLCATGIVSLYAVTFACNAVYHFPFFGQVPTFLLMTLITATAFLLSVRMNAQVVAILGLLGGFLTPVLLSTGHDNPGGLFGFVALLDAGLIAVALHRSWFHLVPLAAAGTVVMQIGWASKFFTVIKAPIAVTVCLAFCALFFAATEIARRLNRPSGHLTLSSAGLALVAFGFGFFFLTYPSIGSQPLLLFSFIFAADLFLLALVWRDDAARRLETLAGGLAFGFLAIWTAGHLSDELLPWGLGAYLFFAVLHTAFPLLLQRVRPEAAPGWLSQLYPPLALLLMTGPLLKSDDVSLLFWPVMLLIDVVAVGLALITASVGALAVVLVFSLAAMGLCILRTTGAEVDYSLLWVIGGFSIFFFAAGMFVARRLGGRILAGSRFSGAGTKALGNTAAQIPALSALLPFVLLIMMSQRLPIAIPTPLFGLSLLLCVLVLGLSRLLILEWLPLCGLIGATALEYAWHARHFDPANGVLPLGWYVIFYALFSVFPFIFHRSFASTTGAWAVAALSGVVHFPLVHKTVLQIWPEIPPGLVPIGFAIAPLIGLATIIRRVPVDTPARLDQLAWFGGATLLFITLVFPLQFERQWITISWALEGTALLWLFHRVPHPGLRATGAVLLMIAFSRLALNPAVLAYHPRSDTPIFNWYLYAYGITLVCLFVSAHLIAPPRNRVLGINLPPLLNALGLVLAFLLLNIQIADYFTPAGSVLTFQFGGNFARDMAYTISWALFALALLGLGIWRSARAARYAALALLVVTLLKLFFHDLSQLDQLYRVGALVVVAAVAILASFLYQRFTPNDDRLTPPTQP